MVADLPPLGLRDVGIGDGPIRYPVHFFAFSSPVFSYLAGCKNVSALPASDSDTMKITALESMSSSSGKKNAFVVVVIQQHDALAL